jgi:signal transduction histidine kinase/predicted RNA-binding protein with RPS1 domain/FixJ family two-component response regulator
MDLTRLWLITKNRFARLHPDRETEFEKISVMPRDHHNFVEGQRVVGTVEKLFRYGLFVSLDDGTRAYIRRRELSWSGNVDPREGWHKGDTIEGIVFKLAEAGQSIELSHRAILPDPWDGFANEFMQGDVVEGTVKSIIDYGVYVEIKPGVDGLVPLRELATWEVKKPDEVIWIGDRVEALITHLDHRTRKVRLSIRARLRQLDVVAGIMEDFELFSELDEPTHNTETSDVGDNISGEVQTDTQVAWGTDPEMHARVGRILIVEDYEAIRKPLAEWLRHEGFEVDEAEDVEIACANVQEVAYGMVFADINLPGRDGLDFLQRMRRRGIDCNVAVMSTAEILEERSQEIEEIGVIEAFVKPLDLDEIKQLVIRIGQGERLPRWQMRPQAPQLQIPEAFQQLAVTMRSNSSLADQLHAGLEHLLMTTSAEVGLIFRLDPISRVVFITARAGQMKLNETALHSLGASPVRDVIEDDEQILENRMSGQTRERFRKLLDLLPFESCIGLPIEAGGETHRALFLFSHTPDAFNRYHLRDALADSLLLSVAIEREQMEQRFRSLNNTLLSGQLAGGFSHEVYNKISGLEIQLRNLQTDCHTFGRKTEEPVSLVDIRQAVDRLQVTFTDLKDTVELFRQLMQAKEEQRVGIHEVLHQTVALLQPILRKEKIKLETYLSLDLPETAGSLMQLQQVFLNIMLNAVQHMRLKSDGRKLLSVTTAYQAKDKMRPLKIRFTDTGPGIHRRHWEKIFDLGFTTRLGGTGQGLYIARSLVESLGGTILVEGSAILIGATFLVELPATLVQGRYDEPTTLKSTAGR